jgi:hypothetical protein
MRLWFGAGALALSMTCCAHAVRAGGKTVHETREVAAFDGISVASGIRVTVERGALAPLDVQGDEALVRRLETVVEGDTLHIRFRRSIGFSWDSGDVEVHVRTPALHAASASGGAHIAGSLGAVDALQLEASGGGELHFRNLDTGEISVSGSGGSVIELSGRAARLSVDISGGTHVKAAKLLVRRVRIEGSGGSEAEVLASDSIRGDLSGGSELTWHGQARTRVATSGGSEIHGDGDDDSDDD